MTPHSIAHWKKFRRMENKRSESDTDDGQSNTFRSIAEELPEQELFQQQISVQEV